ncbi:aminotransferase class I/II-fold pyridoxal phosphate-dependent enzyme [Dactylosporangium fulvum]|uniref:Aminotransferase class I/II-fold pyridoxal phosphate-dependent enzyme n=1 Tax=Dactylosporangium fulvum TaxID=53359 RepID=A0ABY5W5D2_9ACTN|nr:aminotransferase class I/II-fold pyridoxal phosphate-dependent enzyme [Dactylosporangium fulvum]UWP84224.1 aminotransferase class I/II-fold pyridoxal phosphate-dependent enzyme [Dactylosporangium fulvum]
MAVQYQPSAETAAVISGATAAEIATSVEAAVRTGGLDPGAALPPVRTLAATLGVSPATVAAAYRVLRGRGLIETAGRAGTRVRARPPVAHRTGHALGVPEGVVDLASGAPDADLLPGFARHLIKLSRNMPPINYGAGGPLPQLLHLAGERFAADGVPDGRLTVTGGALDGIERALVAHLRPGDRVAVEDPGWANLLDLVAALGLTAVPVPVDDEGPTEDGLSAALSSGVAALVVTGRAQNPTGAFVTRGRALALRRRLMQYRSILVLEDDHAAELAHERPHPLAGATDSWAYIRSLSKPYGPDLRVATVAGDETTVARIEGRMRFGTGWVSTVLQRLVIELWRDPETKGLVRRARDRYAERRQALRDALGGMPARGVSGINVWVPVADETSMVAGLREDGFAVAPGAMYRLVSPSAIRITTAALDPRDAPRVAEAVLRRAAGTIQRQV